MSILPFELFLRTSRSRCFPSLIRVKDICGVLSLESPFAAKPVAIDDDTSRPHGSPRKVEKGVLCTPPRRFNGLPDAVLNRSREALIEELQRMKAESAAPEVPVA